ncbi:alkaline-phosphatase-like protein [Piptocephalis cylindrospora]|uniref:GPI ethanolamine phosphate transferase 2 n=1 Tax=Piptocephalis cylindrospora TaxID=1907219 RepID=A0A4P9Y845_9FUNG|nr:alkaline-phosphatase-like protein [Piptocephalis cylindrospora]|eukprot:RKP14944.1 alkaline-phosphatase-like protein [Piptocephalis cylindrospora]
MSSKVTLLFLLLHLAWVLMFSRGFFPVKTRVPGQGTFSDLPSAPYSTSSGAAAPSGRDPLGYIPPYDQVVFVLVDALRSDFVYGEGSGFHSVRQYLSQGYGEAFVAVARAPTVTLPRLKALVSGTVPAFLDAILNVLEDDDDEKKAGKGNNEQGDGKDAWPSILHLSKNWKIEMYGDDTWMRLLPPHTFTRVEGTTSFFVADTVEVDRNVTRHVPSALNRKGEWDALILHYLGLDHIGHSGGRHSPLMQPKQEEMDAVIDRLFRGLSPPENHPIEGSSPQGPLIILCGDHGMTDAGNHGGSSEAESSTSMLFLHPAWRRPEAKKNEDRFHWSLQNSWSPRNIRQVDLVPTLSLLLGAPIPRNNLGTLIPSTISSLPGKMYNGQGKEKGEASCLWHQGRQFHALFLEAHGIPEGEQRELSEMAANALESKAMEYRVDRMVLALVLGILLWLLLSRKSLPSSQIPHMSMSVLIAAILALQVASVFASSFVEEEHQTWYFWLQSYWMYLLVRPRPGMRRAGLVGQMVLLRLIRTWNQTGQKWAHLPDIRQFLTRPEHEALLWILVLSTLIIMLLRAYRVWGSLGHGRVCFFPRLWLVVTRAATLSILLIQLDPPNLTHSLVARVPYKASTAWCTSDLLFLLLFKPHQLPLIAFFHAQRHLLPSSVGLVSEESILFLFLAHSSFFALGGSNSIASVDLSTAYTGLSSFSAPMVALLTFLSNWSGPLWWALAWIPRRPGFVERRLQDRMILRIMVGLHLALALAVLVLREHLFIWTVFSPKWLYTMAWLAYFLVMYLIWWVRDVWVDKMGAGIEDVD